MFRALSQNLDLREEIVAINVQWRRRYYEYGDFEIQIRIDEYDNDCYYIWNTDTNEVGIVEKVSFETTGTGTYIYYSGHMVESWLSYGVLRANETQAFSATQIHTKCRTLVTNDIINGGIALPIVLGNAPSSTSTTDALPENETETGLVCQKLLKSIEYSQKLRFDYDNKRFYYDIYQGTDRSDTGNETCVFSDTLGNISEIQYSYDTSNYKNYAQIRVSRGGDPERFLDTYYDWSGSEVKRKLRLDTSDTESETDSEAIAKAQTEGKLELLNHRNEENSSFKPAVEWFKYRTDYDLGDKVQLVISALEVSASFRIVGVNEVYKNNTREIELEFGDMKTTTIRKRW